MVDTFNINKPTIIIYVVNYRLRKKSHKYGIEVPRSVQNAYYLDNNNGYNFWG